MRKLDSAEAAREDVRRLDGAIRTRVLRALQRFAETGAGDLRRLKGVEDTRLRVGDYRVRFVEIGDTVLVKRVLHRSEAYKD